MRSKILVTGGGGQLARAIIAIDGEVLAPDRAEMDITSENSLDAYCAAHRPDVIIHAAAVTNRYAEDMDAEYIRTNIIGTSLVALWCLKNDTRLVYVSTDYVYPGETGAFTEESPLFPVNRYAASKLGGECAVGMVKNSLIIRTSFYGTLDFPAGSTDQFTSRMPLREAAEAVYRLALRHEVRGVINVGRAERRSVYEIIKNEFLPNVKPVTRKELGVPYHIPFDSSLSTRRFVNLMTSAPASSRTLTACRVCGSTSLLKYIDLGATPLANSYIREEDRAAPEFREELAIQVCRTCGLSQLTKVVHPDLMFKNYLYVSSTTETFRTHCEEMAATTTRVAGIPQGSLVMDIASNDGCLLSKYQEIGMRVIGVDPAENLAAEANAAGIPTLNVYWSPAIAKDIVARYGQPSVITATNVFAHVDDLHGFVQGVEACLARKGIFVIECPYALDFIRKNLDFRPLSAFALTPLLFGMAHEPRWRWRAGWGWLAGTLYWGVTCSWIQGVLNVHGGLSLGLSILALSLFAVIKGLHLAVFAALGGAFLKRPWGLLAVPALWTGLERSHSFLGFTWLQLGNAAIEMSVPLRAAPWAGVYGVSFVLAALSTGLAWVLLRKPRRELIWLAPLLGLAALPAMPPDAPPQATAVALQPALNDESMREREEYEKGMKRLALATLGEAINPSKPAPQLLLWPETPGPFYYFRDAFFRETVTQIARLSSAPFVFGTVLWNAQGAPLNSAILLESDGRLAGRYDKVNLVPFGEYVPALFGWVNKVSNEAGDYAPGEKTVMFPTEKGTVGPFICYESAFPGHVREIADQGAHVLLNLTNDGYFLRGPARRQHLLLARMRAVENRRWLLRPTNDGLTASISPSGLVHDAFPEYAARAGRLHFNWIREKTFYTRHGDLFAWACLAAAVVLRIVAELPHYG